MKFTKMHGLGNDYLYVYGAVPENIVSLSQRLSERHFGAGSDGMIFIAPSRIADFSMRIFNADGSEAKMCGNGIRCVGKYVYDKGFTDKTRLTVETLSGVKTLKLHLKNGAADRVTVSMGKAVVSPPQTIETNGEAVTYVPVSVGNPHAVIFCENADCAPVEALGPAMERHPAFPDGVNVEFVQVLSPREMRMRVWERGSGVTLACGTGASASTAAAVKCGLCMPDTPITVRLDGGALEITVAPDGEITMTGPATFVYEGETVEC